jgi:molybdopterin-binding protein
MIGLEADSSAAVMGTSTESCQPDRRCAMTLSARNQLKGTVKEVTTGVITAKVVIDIGGGNEIVAVVTKDAVEDLGLKPGSAATAVIKATEVLIMT